MYAKVNFVYPTRLLLLEHVGLVLVVKKLNDGHPRVTVIHIVAKPGSVDHSQTDYGTEVSVLLLDLGTGSRYL